MASDLCPTCGASLTNPNPMSWCACPKADMPSGAVERELPPLPERNRRFLCTKCGATTCKRGQERQTNPECVCGYLGFAEDADFTADQMHEYARAALATQPLEQKPVAYRISDPNEPEIGHWYEDAPNGTPYLTSEPLYLGPQPEQVDQDSEFEKALMAFADRQYCLGIEQMRRDECLGWEHKVATRKFTQVEMAAHTQANKYFGAHDGIYNAIRAARASGKGGGE